MIGQLLKQIPNFHMMMLHPNLYNIPEDREKDVALQYYGLIVQKVVEGPRSDRWSKLLPFNSGPHQAAIVGTL